MFEDGRSKGIGVSQNGTQSTLDGVGNLFSLARARAQMYGIKLFRRIEIYFHRGCYHT